MSRIIFDGKILVYDSRGRVIEVPKETENTGTTFETVDEFIKRGGTVRTPKNSDLRQVIVRKANSVTKNSVIVSDNNTAREMQSYLELWGKV